MNLITQYLASQFVFFNKNHFLEFRDLINESLKLIIWTIYYKIKVEIKRTL